MTAKIERLRITGMDYVKEDLDEFWPSLSVIGVAAINDDGEVLTALGSKGKSLEPYLMIGALEQLKRDFLEEID